MWLVGTLLALTIAMVAHAVLCRASMPLNSVTQFVITASLVSSCLLWWLFDRYGVTAPQTWAGATVYALCCEFYVFLFTFAMSSITANLLSNLSRRDMTDTDIEKIYESRHMVATRLDRLVAIGLVDEGPTGLRLTAAGARMVRAFRLLRSLFRHPRPTYNFSPNN
jgi:hypothetical protein